MVKRLFVVCRKASESPRGLVKLKRCKKCKNLYWISALKTSKKNQKEDMQSGTANIL